MRKKWNVMIVLVFAVLMIADVNALQPYSKIRQAWFKVKIFDRYCRELELYDRYDRVRKFAKDLGYYAINCDECRMFIGISETDCRAYCDLCKVLIVRHELPQVQSMQIENIYIEQGLERSS